MSTSYVETVSTAFTITHAKRLASKVRTDLMRIHRLYDGRPSLHRIDKFEEEVTILLRDGYLDTVAYGFKRNGNWIAPTLRYTAEVLLFGSGVDDRPGAVKPNLDVSGASFYSFLTYSDAWFALTANEQDAYERALPIQRSAGNAPGVVGYFASDKNYSAGGRALNRSSLRSV